MNIINLSKDSSISYPVLDGYVTTENLSGTLDSITVIIPHVLDSNFEPYDLVMVGYYGWLVADVTKEMISVSVDSENNKTIYYNITLDLMSFTKFLETIQLPNLAITNIGQNRSIAYYALQYWSRYVSPALRKSYSSSNYTISDFSRIYNKLNSVVCPEYTFQSPTAREVFDALFSKLGCIIKLEFKYNPFYETNQYVLYVDMLNLTQCKKPINEDYLTSLVKVQSAEDYVTALSHSLDGVIGQESVTEYQRFKSEDYLMNSNNASILLNQKPYDIDKIEILNGRFNLRATLKTDYMVDGEYVVIEEGVIWFTDDVTEITWVTNYYNDMPLDPTSSKLGVKIPIRALDITPNYVTREVFESLSQTKDYFQSDGTRYTQNLSTLLKNNTFFGSRGSNKIDGLLNYQEKQTMWWTTTDYEVVKIVTALAAIRYLNTNPNILSFTDSNHNNTRWYFEPIGDWVKYVFYGDHQGNTGFPSYNDIHFKITYKPYMNARFEIEDGEKNSHHVVMQDNSTNALTDINQYLAQSVEKNMKLGNPTIIATARVPSNITTLYKLGEYYQDGTDRYILSTVESQHKANETLYKFTLTKNFTNRNLNTIINREKRYYALATDEVVERSEIVKKTYINIFLDTQENAKSLHDSNIWPTSGYIPSCLCFITYDDNNTNIASGNIPLNTIYGGNSVIYSATFMDNTNYKLYPLSKREGGYPMQQYKYTNDSGELDKITCFFGIPFNYNSLINQSYVLPILGRFSEPTDITLHKDQREKLTINYEYIYKASDSKIKIGSHFIDALLKNTNIQIKVRYYYTNGSYQDKFTSSGIPYSFAVTDDDVQAIMMLTPNDEDVMIIYNPSSGIYLNFNMEVEN